MTRFIRNLLSALLATLIVIAAPLRAENATTSKGATSPLQAAQPSAPPRLPAPAIRPAAPPSPVATPSSDVSAPSLQPGEILLNFQAADIQAVVKAVSQMTGRNFLIDPRVKGQVTIISAKPVTSQAAYQIFLSSLKAQGFTAVEGLGHTRIVPTTEAKTSADVVDQPYGGEKIMTHVLVVQYSSPTQMIPLLRPLMAPTSQIAAYDPANALIITDYAENIRRLIRIVEKIDQPVSSDVTVINLKHASALDLADLVARLSLPSGAPGVPAAPQHAGGDRFTIIPDMRTNSLLVRADNPGRVNQIRSLVEKLDVQATRGGHTRVVYLRNADAVKLAEVLRGLIAGEARAQQTAASAIPASPGAAAARPAATGAASRAEASLVQADEATNALIINAPDATYNNLRAVIEKLDVRRTQVYVEAMIVEMSTDAAHELGVQWSGDATAGSGNVVAVQNFPNANPSLLGAIANPASTASAGGLLLGYIGDQVTLPDGTVVRTLGALARALEQRNLANILSTPNLMTLDNAEAKIVVGQNVPFVTGSFAQAAGATPGAAVNPFQTIERKDVGLTLKIKPQVSEGGLLKLDIYQEISSVEPTAGTGASDLITNKRSIETKVLVDDGHTIVLGGLIEDNRTESEQSVPFLGSIPYLGALFRYKQKTGRRTNLMVFLRPNILYGPADAHSVTTDRYQFLRKQNRDKRREATFQRYEPVAPDHKPNKDKDPRRRDDNEPAPAVAEKTTAPPANEPSPPATDAAPDETP